MYMKEVLRLRNALRSKHLGIKSQNFLYLTSECDQKYHSTDSSSNHNIYKQHHLKYIVGISGLCLGLVYFKMCRGSPLLAAEVVAGDKLDNLPFYSMREVSKHSDRKTGIWVVYRNGVYDISDFIDQHPGGDKILMAAGGSVEPFWHIYGVHKQEHILSMLESYRIGNLEGSEVFEKSAEDDPYYNEPLRHPALKPSAERPYNAEPPPELLVDSYITPQEVFYVRNHLPVPEINLDSYELEICGLGMKSKTLTLDDVKKMPKHSVTASIQCAGNRRSEMSQVKIVKGLNWGHAAIGNATWTGVRLRDLLLKLGVNEDSATGHVHFEGLDCDGSGCPYAASIPLEKAMDPHGDVILAYEMNGQPLSRDHGFPLRAVVPGIVGARNVKWLGRIVLSEEESDSHWQKNDYKGFSPSTDWDSVVWSSAPAIQDLPVNSAICFPKDGQQVSLNRDQTLCVKGYAWSGGGRGIVRVDLTIDGGKTWQTADLCECEPIRYSRNWAWTLWAGHLQIPPDINSVEIWVKATDTSYNTQPESFSNIWNLRGVLGNAYHRVKVAIKKS